jgi:NADPH-dependent glutamate synthase beta subunit-like oxidoreductase
MMSSRKDLTGPPDLAHQRRTGPVRLQRPEYVDLLPPCNQACPAGEDIQGWLALVEAGRIEDAWRHLMRDNPMPAVHGRVCYHPCETGCNRGQLDAAVNIHAVERFLGDRAREAGWKVVPEAPGSGRRVLVVGAGPSGLSAAYHLTRLGHSVEVREAGPVAGGMMVFGIPAYRLPRNVLADEVRRIEEMGVRFVFNHKVEDLLAEKQGGAFDAVFLAIGAHIGKRTEIPARDAGKILDALAFLRGASDGSAPKLGRRVAIYGGGNTAMDAARTAKRLGYEPLIIYRRDRNHMPASSEEADEAVAEGVKIHWLRTIKTIDARSFTVEIMELDSGGRPQPTGRLESIEADSLVLALGQDVDTGFLKDVAGLKMKDDGTIEVSPNMMTGTSGIFAGGDMVPSERTVTVAVGHGKKAARNIDAYLRGHASSKPPNHPVAAFGMLHLPFYADAARRPQQHLDAARRLTSFDEVVSGLGESEATFEAKRCLSCGNCFECDGCYGACPEDAIVKLGPGQRYRYDYDRCTGCAVCFEQCPCHAIEMRPEP